MQSCTITPAGGGSALRRVSSQVSSSSNEPLSPRVDVTMARLPAQWQILGRLLPVGFAELEIQSKAVSLHQEIMAMSEMNIGYAFLGGLQLLDLLQQESSCGGNLRR